MEREEGRDWGLGNLKLINLGSHLSQICNEGQGDEERGHWTKTGGHKLVASGHRHIFGGLTDHFKSFRT